MCKYLRNKNGFTLVELTIGVGILAFVLCGIVSGLVSLTFLSEMSRDKTVALNDARQVMEEVEDTPFSDIDDIGDWTTWVLNKAIKTLDETKNEQIKVTTSYVLKDESGNDVKDLLQITVRVGWKTRNRPMSVSLVTLKTKG